MGFTVRVPATVANLGPGFDTLGAAVAVHLEVDVEPGPEQRLSFAGEGAEELAATSPNLMVTALEAGAEALHGPASATMAVRNGVPLASGLGSSSAAVVAGLLIAEGLAGRPFPPGGLLALASEIEGHPDNVAPAVLGGLVIAYRAANGDLRWSRSLPSDRIIPALAVPARGFSTWEARRALSRDISWDDATFTASRVALVVAALISGEVAALRDGFEDRLHQPHRLALMPETSALYDTLRAGGLPVALAGAGPSLLVALERAHLTSQATRLRAACADQPGDWRVLVTDWETEGARRLTADR